MNLAAMQALGAIRQTKALCLPLDWANAFQDTPLLIVLAAHAAAVPENDPHAYVGVSENALAREWGLDRESLRARKRLAIQRGFLQPRTDPPRGVPLPCRVNWPQIGEAVENRHHGVDGIPPGGLAENRHGVDGIPRASPAPPYKERAPAPASFDLASLGSKLASAQPQAEAEENAALEEAIEDAIRRSRLAEIHGAKLNEFTVRTLRKALKPIEHDETAVKIELDRIERKCEYVRRHPDSADSWGVLVAMVRADVKTFLKDSTPERKPPEREDPAFDIHANVKAAAAAMGRKR